LEERNAARYTSNLTELWLKQTVERLDTPPTLILDLCACHQIKKLSAINKQYYFSSFHDILCNIGSLFGIIYSSLCLILLWKILH
jgi:hypothetical protein